MSNLKTLKMGTEFVLEAISFTHSKNIEKSTPSIQWTITPEGGSAENIGTGKAIRYKISNKYAGKKVTFRAFIKEDSKEKFPQQCITCFIEEQVSVKGIRIKEVKGMKNAKAGDTVEFKVTVDIEVEAESSSSYKVKTKMLIGDWYGSDWGDIYQGKSYEEIYSELGNQYSALGKILAGDQISQNAHAQVQLQKKKHVKGYLPSLNAFFMLQHFYGTHHKYVPFETEIIFVSGNTIFIEKNK